MTLSHLMLHITCVLHNTAIHDAQHSHIWWKTQQQIICNVVLQILIIFFSQYAMHYTAISDGKHSSKSFVMLRCRFWHVLLCFASRVRCTTLEYAMHYTAVCDGNYIDNILTIYAVNAWCTTLEYAMHYTAVCDGKHSNKSFVTMLCCRFPFLQKKNYKKHNVCCRFPFFFKKNGNLQHTLCFL